jgi:hypothetical protein
MVSFEGAVALILALGFGAIIVMSLLQRSRVQQSIQEHAAATAETLIAQLRSEIFDARKEVIALRETVQGLTAQLETTRIDALKDATAKDIAALRVEIDKIKGRP